MDEQARQQAFVSALVTEHFVLQSARSTTVTEANGRAAIYLTSVSSALVAFGFVAQVANQLDPFMAAVLPALFVLGVFTFIRLVENSIENLVFLEQIQRIRGYYAGLVPEARAFFASGTRMPSGSPAGAGVDGTDQGEMATALASTGWAPRGWRCCSPRPAWWARSTASWVESGSRCWCGGRPASTPPARCWSGWWPPWWCSGCTLSGRAGEATRPWGGARRAAAGVVGRGDTYNSSKWGPHAGEEACPMATGGGSAVLVADGHDGPLGAPRRHPDHPSPPRLRADRHPKLR
jgi:hypothetical protein